MPLTDVAPLEASTTISAPVEQVWGLVSDVRNYARWSPQTAKTFVRGEGVGAKMFNINRKGLLVWPTQAQIVTFERNEKIAFRVKENWTIWSFSLEADGANTVLTQRREAPKGISDLSVTLTKRILGGLDEFTAELKSGMASTLAQIKAEAEA